MNHEIVIAGFGGQGILFAGKVLVYAGMLDGHQVSWLPSYGPEMRGGTANCSVIISDSPIGSPIVNDPGVLVAMNLPSLDKFENAIVKDGYAFIDSTLISRKVERSDVKSFYIPATQMAQENGMKGLANMIMLGKVIRELGVMDMESVKNGLMKVIPERKRDMLEVNLKAVELGYNY
ncbi:MAG: 2-oxoacid:ferredoxin oxidoreductase subunit gamma [Ruminococcaceae bacterium]|nr:2-oxoacid:ferredoxin oxidoreductase subunit gamma [Oscillospiraceae bacterium]